MNTAIEMIKDAGLPTHVLLMVLCVAAVWWTVVTLSRTIIEHGPKWRSAKTSARLPRDAELVLDRQLEQLQQQLRHQSETFDRVAGPDKVLQHNVSVYLGQAFMYAAQEVKRLIRESNERRLLELAKMLEEMKAPEPLAGAVILHAELLASDGIAATDFSISGGVSVLTTPQRVDELVQRTGKRRVGDLGMVPFLRRYLPPEFYGLTGDVSRSFQEVNTAIVEHLKRQPRLDGSLLYELYAQSLIGPNWRETTGAPAAAREPPRLTDVDRDPRGLPPR